MKRFLLIIFLIIFIGCGGGGSDSQSPNNNLNDICITFGDSITYGYLITDPYPWRLSDLIGKTVINAGTDGGTSAVGLSIIQNYLDEYHPKYVTIYYGTNDATSMSPDTSEYYLREMVKAAKDTGAFVIIATLQPVLFGQWEYSQSAHVEISKRIRNIAQEEVIGLADIEKCKIWVEEDFLSDGLHPTDNAHAIIAEPFANEIK